VNQSQFNDLVARLQQHTKTPLPRLEISEYKLDGQLIKVMGSRADGSDTRPTPDEVVDVTAGFITQLINKIETQALQITKLREQLVNLAEATAQFMDRNTDLLNTLFPEKENACPPSPPDSNPPKCTSSVSAASSTSAANLSSPSTDSSPSTPTASAPSVTPSDPSN
jgi:hypothetical protein